MWKYIQQHESPNNSRETREHTQTIIFIVQTMRWNSTENNTFFLVISLYIYFYCEYNSFRECEMHLLAILDTNRRSEGSRRWKSISYEF